MKNESKYADIRIIDAAKVENTVCQLFIKANHILPDDIEKSIAASAADESSKIAKCVFGRIQENIKAAVELDIPICQDTGMAVVFAEIGEHVHISGGTLEEAVNSGVRRAYIEGALRLSVVRDPLYLRENTNDNTPAILHIKTIKGSKLRLIAAPKGFGSENMSALKMFTPSANEEDIVQFVCDTVIKAGSNPCPPVIVGVGIGGDFEYSAYLAKYALLRGAKTDNNDTQRAECRYAALEKRILNEINKSGIGAQGFGGDITALAVNIEHAPTHIAGLPVAVNINCHVARHAEAII